MVQGMVCLPQAPIGHTHHAAKWHIPSRVPKNAGPVPATAAVMLAATQRAWASKPSKSQKESQKESLEEVILALMSLTSLTRRRDSRSIIAQLEKLRMLRRETMTWQAAAKLLDALEKVLDSSPSLGPPLPLDACVTALIAAANAQALQRRKLSAERLDVFCQALERSLSATEPSEAREPSEIERLPDLLSYGLWALVKLGDRGSFVLQRLLQRSVAEMQRFESAHLSRLVWSLATATIRDGQILSSLAQRTQQVRLHPQLGLAMLAWSFAKLRFKEAGLMESISSHACGHVKLFKISELSNITWAFATQQVPFATASPLFSAISETAVRGLEKFKHQELAMLLWSYAKLKIVERKLISAASEDVLKRISPEAGGALRAQHLANFAWAFAKMRSDRSDPSDPSDLDPSEVVMRLAVLALQRAEELKPLELASLVWALAQSNGASTASTRLAMHLTKEASTRRMKPQELCNLLWSAATLAFHQQEVLKTLTAKLDWQTTNQFGILDLANASWALAKLQQDDFEVFHRLQKQLDCHLQDATPQQLSNLAWAFATVSIVDGVDGVDGHTTMARIANEAQDRIPQFSSQGLANLVWALANQNVECDAFFQAVGDRLVLMKLDDCQGSDALAWAVDIAQIVKSFNDISFHHPCVSWSTHALPRVGSDLDRRLRALEEIPTHPTQKLEKSDDFDISNKSESVGSPKVLWESEDRCVLLKPPGWQVDTEGTEEDFIERTHATREMLSQFMASSYATVKYPILADIKCKNGFLHRLDVPSSGLILVAKKYNAYFDLLMQLHRGEIHRDYLVLLHGLAQRKVVAVRLAKEALTSWSGRQHVVKDFFHGNEKQGKKIKSLKKGKPSLTELRVGGWAATREGGSLSLAAIRIGSGRRHQIRVHMAHIGHPSVTDGRYTTEETFFEDQQWCERNFLHRFGIGFKDSDGLQSTICELPEDLCAALWQLRPWDMQSAETMDLWQSIGPIDTEPTLSSLSSPLTWEDMPLLQKRAACIP